MIYTDADDTATEIMIQHQHLDTVLAFVVDRDDVRRIEAARAPAAVQIGGSSSPTLPAPAGHVDEAEPRLRVCA